jgi:flotillin
MTLELIFVLALVGALVLIALYVMVSRLLYVSTPNEVLVFSGSTRQIGGKQVGFRFVRGGRSLRRPLIERVDRMDLSMLTVMVHVTGAFSKGGIPLTVQGVANVKLPGDEPLLSNAVERFLGRTREEIHHVAKELLEGNLRGVLARLTPEEVNEDKLRFAHTLLEEAEHDMSRVGLVLDTLKIQNVTDDVNYLASIGRIRGATLNMRQAVAEAEAQADGAVQQAKNWSLAQVARLDADLKIAREETNKRVAEATSRREALIREAQGTVLAELAQVKAEILRQRARAPQEKRRLEADVVEPALARQRAAEQHARGEAATTIERGRAEAQSLAALVEAHSRGGSSAREVLAFQKILPQLAQIAGAQSPLAIQRLSVLPQTQTPGSELARQVIGVVEQVRTATGVDLARAARRLSDGDER